MEAISLIDESEILTILTIYNSLLENMKKTCWQVPTTNLNAPNTTNALIRSKGTI